MFLILLSCLLLHLGLGKHGWMSLQGQIKEFGKGRGSPGTYKCYDRYKTETIVYFGFVTCCISLESGPHYEVSPIFHCDAKLLALGLRFGGLICIG